MTLAISPWPPVPPVGTTAQVERIGGGLGLTANKGGGNGSGPRMSPRYSADKSPDLEHRFLSIRWKDNRGASWSKELGIDIGLIGPQPLLIELKRLGVYQSRQWEIISMSNVPLIVVSIEEEVELLGS